MQLSITKRSLRRIYYPIWRIAKYKIAAWRFRACNLSSDEKSWTTASGRNYFYSNVSQILIYRKTRYRVLYCIVCFDHVIRKTSMVDTWSRTELVSGRRGRRKTRFWETIRYYYSHLSQKWTSSLNFHTWQVKVSLSIFISNLHFSATKILCKKHAF